MKKLYLFATNNGDGSSSIKLTFNKQLIDDMEESYHRDELTEQFFDADGFHYTTLMVPDECTPESMGFRELTHQDVFDFYDIPRPTPKMK